MGPHRGRHGPGRGRRTRPRRGRLRLAGPPPEPGRLLVRRLRRRRRRRPHRPRPGDQLLRLPRGRGLAPLPVHRGRDVPRPDVAGGPRGDRVRPGTPAARRRDRLEAGGRRHARPRRPADRLVLRLPGTALRPGHGRTARGAAARLGTGPRPPRPRDTPPPRAVPRQVPLLHGLVLPGAGRRGARHGGPGADRRGLGPLRRPRPGRALRGAQPLGHRRRERGTGAGTVGDGGVRPGRDDPQVDPAPARRQRHVLDRLRLRGPGDLAAGTHVLDRRFAAAGGGRTGRRRSHHRGLRRRTAAGRAGAGLLSGWRPSDGRDRLRTMLPSRTEPAGGAP